MHVHDISSVLFRVKIQYSSRLRLRFKIQHTAESRTLEWTTAVTSVNHLKGNLCPTRIDKEPLTDCGGWGWMFSKLDLLLFVIISSLLVDCQFLTFRIKILFYEKYINSDHSFSIPVLKCL